MAEDEGSRDDWVGWMIRLEPVGCNVLHKPFGVERQPVSVKCARGSFRDFPEWLAIIGVKRAAFNVAAIGSAAGRCQAIGRRCREQGGGVDLRNLGDRTRRQVAENLPASDSPQAVEHCCHFGIADLARYVGRAGSVLAAATGFRTLRGHRVLPAAPEPGGAARTFARFRRQCREMPARDRLSDQGTLPGLRIAGAMAN